MHQIADGSELRARACFGGLDLSSKIDLTAFSLVWLLGDGEYAAAEWYWMPDEKIPERTKQDGRPYALWARQGWIHAQPGPVVDVRAVRDEILALRGIFDIQEIAFDQWGARAIAQDLSDAGMTMVEFQQDARSFSEPTKELLNLILQRRIVHDASPVSRFCADCLEVRADTNDRIRPIKPDRQKAAKRIDGMVARIMALDRAMRHSQQREPEIFALA